ncbi:MAG: TonB-dependent receptor domain-containing protein [Candidatus Tyrphobacter sp.]
MERFRFWYRSVAAALAFGFALAPLVPAYSETTGGITGTVTDARTHAPMAGVTVTATSPSQTARATTDASGKYVFLSLAPDTYTLSAQKAGYEPVSDSGISVFAAQSQVVAIVMRPSLAVIARARTSSLSPVKPGTTTDVYSVNPALAAAAAPLGGGGGLNNAYSAIAAMPGAYVPPDQMGVNQTVYIRGGFYDQIGYEYDGVPVNRSFDNYPSYSATTLGQQELEIYAGGGPASANATGLAGFINQVIKTGTYPGYATLTASLGAPSFYHDVSFEAGGATPDRNFSYYVGLSGIDQDFRYLTNANGATLTGEFPITYADNITTNLPFWPAVYPTCNNDNPTNFYSNPAVSGATPPYADPGCFDVLDPQLDSVSNIADRETIVNLHFGIPRKHGNRDDVQLLYSNSAVFTQYYSSVNDIGPLVSTLENPALGYLYSPQWPDFYTYPTGTQFLAPATTPVIGYRFPGSPTDDCVNQTGEVDFPLPIPDACPANTYATLPSDERDGRWDQASIVKIQYQHDIGENAYLRAFGYTFYSNTNRSGPIQEGITGPYGSLNLGATNYDYEVDSHTSGGELQFADQVTDTNQILFTGNYVTSRTLRYYNFNYFNTGTWQTSSLTNGTQCFAAYSGTLANGVDFVNAGQPAPCNDPITQGTFEYPTMSYDDPSGLPQNQNCSGGPNAPIPAGACASDASWELTYTGNQAEVNSITPKFATVSLEDEWRPNDALDVSASVREDRDEFDLTPVANAGTNFWYAAARREFCYDPQTLQPVIVPEPPQFLGNVSPYVSFSCPLVGSVQSVHPDGANGHLYLSDVIPPDYVQSYFSPRFGVTYTLDRNTVLRFSAGRFAQEPQNYEVEYDSVEPNLAAELIGFLPFGFTTPLHRVLAQFSDNFDFSLEHRFGNSNVAMKLTPYYRWATNQLYETVNIPTLFGVSPSFNSGTQRTYGLELEITKGDFSENGFAGVLSYTYTNSKEMWANYVGTDINPVDPYNQDIENFNALTKAGGGAPCYTNAGNGTPDPACGPTSILNPYYAMQLQPLLDKFGWYDSGLDYPYVSPNTLALVLNYRHNRFAITPALSLNEGASYGTPADVQGLDPRTCFSNQGSEGIPGAANPLTADYTSCSLAAVGANGTSPGTLYIPNPYTHAFDTFGEFRQPWQLNVGLRVSYNLTPRVTAFVTVANLVNRCFGGSVEPWTQQYPPNEYVCGYGYNKFYISDYFNGASPNDVTANGVPLNPYFAQPFSPSYGDVNSLNLPLPLQVYFQLQIKI